MTDLVGTSAIMVSCGLFGVFQGCAGDTDGSVISSLARAHIPAALILSIFQLFRL